MANLQANVRSQYAIALNDLPRLLKSANQLFHANSSDSSYATLFFGDYDDSTRRLRYANCGHLPPLVLRAGTTTATPRHEPGTRFGSESVSGCESGCSSEAVVERLAPTCTVLGLFEDWECSVAEVQLAPGDTLVLYTDGVTEASNSAGEEFGECRLIEALRECGRADGHGQMDVQSLLERVVAVVQQFSAGEQADDITLVVARCRC
jgi:serine phosphatase RsbU (regulator of sigma subunit)